MKKVEGTNCDPLTGGAGGSGGGSFVRPDKVEQGPIVRDEANVNRVQEWLIGRGHSISRNGKPDGMWGNRQSDAFQSEITKLQRENGLPPNGKYDAATRDALLQDPRNRRLVEGLDALERQGILPRVYQPVPQKPDLSGGMCRVDPNNDPLLRLQGQGGQGGGNQFSSKPPPVIGHRPDLGVQEPVPSQFYHPVMRFERGADGALRERTTDGGYTQGLGQRANWRPDEGTNGIRSPLGEPLSAVHQRANSWGGETALDTLAQQRSGMDVKPLENFDLKQGGTPLKFMNV